MIFTTVSSCVSDPVVFYDGGEEETFPLSFTLHGRQVQLAVDPLAPECRQWRHYYNDSELNALSAILQLKYLFRCNVETAIDQVLKRPVHLQPFHFGEEEITVCFTYDEVSNGHYVFWLVGILSRSLTHSEFQGRIDQIKKYWLKNG